MKMLKKSNGDRFDIDLILKTYYQNYQLINMFKYYTCMCNYFIYIKFNNLIKIRFLFYLNEF